MASNNTSASTAASATVVKVTRTSIHTPLKPASVQDLKAKFDPGKAGDGSSHADSTLSITTSNSTTKSLSPNSERKGQNEHTEQMSSNSKPSSNVSLSSVSSSLQAAAQRKLGATANNSSSLPQSNLRSAAKSSIALTAARPFSPPSLSSSKSGSTTSSGRSSPTMDSSIKATSSQSLSSVVNKWEPKSITKTSWSSVTTSTSHSGTSSKINDTFSPTDFKNCFNKDKDGRLELPVMHISTSGSDTNVEIWPKSSTLDNKFRSINVKRDDTNSGPVGKKDAKTKSYNTDFNCAIKPSLKAEQQPSSSGESSPPVQRTKKLVAREIKIERLESGVHVTSYKDGDQPEATKTSAKQSSNSSEVGKKIREIKVERVTTEQQLSSGGSNTDKTQPEFIKVKLRKTKQELSSDDSSKSASVDIAKDKVTDLDDKRLSRKMSSDRFERLMFDFQRGVPTEGILRRGSETDHIALQQKARELTKPVLEEDVPIIARKKKEESIFTEGLKVSDFVKQVNKMNPEVEGPPKWKVQRVQSQTSSIASSDVSGDNFYQGIPGEDVENISDDDDIYEKVTRKVDNHQDGEQAKAPERRLGVYRKANLGKSQDKSRSKSASDGDEKVIHSDGEGGWDNSDLSSSGTEYEDVGPDGDDIEGECFYEDLESLSLPASNAAKNKTLGHKLKQIFNKTGAKSKRNKTQVDSGTDSEADTVDDTDEVDNDLIETLSRTSSERSSGHLTRDNTTLSSTSTTTSIATTASTTEEVPTTTCGLTINQSQAPMASSNMPPPPLPPRTTKALNQPPENSPPLPPRNPALSNKSSLGVTLDTVVPISPTGRSSTLPYCNKSKDRYSFGASSQDGSDSGSASSKIEYIDYDPASPGTLERLERSEEDAGTKKSWMTTNEMDRRDGVINPDEHGQIFTEIKRQKRMKNFDPEGHQESETT